ncbi:MAG: helix-turn-helix domain-containing protein [Gammaproteobacteria bacterium]|nr:helix-turn-helix domain-containing protein [Gammaproteobacteria bacterium]MBU1466648.1 helix-turn-helix domain-containing protein [Gammaproteobacteria bacterium]MBU2022518.1 helix-turn-helix domain-containing protein [Gammaproteobacteria bacterium]MBU2237520.1 helix-turn-helix domain-containing protein [Gammaproteobacteria bacterium]MBU2321061.1 helix-turn-helix domain-containing protein [Gammaproteobacteria bacterium]
MRTLYNTQQVAPHERQSYWQDVVSKTFVELDCRIPTPELFQGHIHAQSLADLTTVEVVSSAQSVNRNNKQIARSDAQFILISLVTEGTSQLRQGEREAILHAGDFSIYDTCDPYQLNFEGAFNQTVIQIPRENLQQRLGNLKRLTAIPLSRNNPLERLAFDFLLGLGKLENNMQIIQQQQLAELALDLLSIALAEKSCRDINLSDYAATQLMAIKEYIHRNLHNSDLCPSLLARQFKISMRYMSSLFQREHTTCSRYILRCRLNHCAEQLRQLPHQQISQIAYRWGFNDMTYFSRVFKAQFALTPRSYRQERI